MKISNKEKWNAVVKCDDSYDGEFFYGVRTTGIFCRPSCKSKEPLRGNVDFFDSIDQAYEQGLRPCKRCRPDLFEYKPSLEIAEKSKRIYDECFCDKGKLEYEIKTLGISKNRLINIFREQYKMTPVEYLNRLRADKAAKLLENTDISILEIAMQCGFGSSSSFYTLFKKQFLTAPKKYRESRRRRI